MRKTVVVHELRMQFADEAHALFAYVNCSAAPRMKGREGFLHETGLERRDEALDVPLDVIEVDATGLDAPLHVTGRPVGETGDVRRLGARP